MGKKTKKKKKKKRKKDVDVTWQTTITLLVPDPIAELDKKVLHGIGRLAHAAASPFGVEQIAVLRTSDLVKTSGETAFGPEAAMAVPQLAEIVPAWLKLL